MWYVEQRIQRVYDSWPADSTGIVIRDGVKENVRKVIILLTLVTLSFNYTMGQTTGEKIEMRTYIVTYTSGTVRNSETGVVCEVEARNPEKAIRKAIDMNFSDPESCSLWEIHHDSQTRQYARLENPASFKSGMIDYYAAFEGSLLRNSRSEHHYYLQRYNQEGIVEEDEIWAVSAEKALESYIKRLDIDWPITVESQFRAYAEKLSEASLGSPRVWILAKIVDYLPGELKQYE